MEEIQAESAAYYSYDDEPYGGLQRNQADIGRAKNSRGNRWIRVNSCKDKQEIPATKLDFEVLSLEEIRRRKKEKELVAGAVISEPLPSTEKKGVKRHSLPTEQCSKESDSPPKKRRISISEFVKNNEPITVKIPPVKLRRSLKNTTASETETQSGCKDKRETAEDQDVNQTSCRERLENNIDDLASVSRKGEVEVRLCDSSTKEERTQTQSERAMEDKKSVATYTSEDINVMFDAQPYRTAAPEEYLRLDASSDEIMRDIEALLK